MRGVTIRLYLTQDLVSAKHVPNGVPQGPYERRVTALGRDEVCLTPQRYVVAAG